MQWWTSRQVDSPDWDAYWKETHDPDGANRDRLQEKRQYLDDRREELAFIESLAGGWILDVGCGPGWLLSALSSKWQKIGLEPSLEMADLCVRDGLKVIAKTMPHASLRPRSFDVVVHYHVIEHCPDPDQEIWHVRNVMKEGGWLVLGTPDFGSPCAKRFGDKYRMLDDSTHCSLFTTADLVGWLREHDLTVSNVRFPFPDRYATADNFARWNDTSRMSPPWPGNWVTVYCRK